MFRLLCPFRDDRHIFMNVDLLRSRCAYLFHALQISSRALMAFSLLLALLAQSANGQIKPSHSFWTAQQEVIVLRCDESNGNPCFYDVNDEGIVSYDRRGTLDRYTYDVYQNEMGIVRRRLISASSHAVMEQGRREQLVNYPQRYALVFDLGGGQAVRVPLVFPNTTSTTLGDRQILGIKCHGVLRKWVQQRNRFRRSEETWIATGSDFKEPLFQVDYGSGNNSILVEVHVIRSFKVSPPLEPSIFKLPGAYQVV